MKEFVGKVGRIQMRESGSGASALYRVVLDQPVSIPGVGAVRDDLWESRFLKTVRA